MLTLCGGFVVFGRGILIDMGEVGRLARRINLLDADRVHRQTRKWQPEPHQVPPPGQWRGWALLAGRGSGKTDACAAYVQQHVTGPPCLPGPVPHWIGIIAPTLGDAATSCFYGPSGIRVHSPGSKLINGIGGATVRWPNGSEAKLFGAHTPEDVERLRSGGNRCLVWMEELAAWRYLDASWAHMRFGLRVGPRPHWIASTTPKPKMLIKRISNGEIRGTVVTRASMYDNPHLQDDIKEALEEEYGGTQLGRQELYAEILDQDENALWTHDLIDASRVLRDATPDMVRRTVGVDPSGGAGEQGIVVVGKSMQERQHEDARKRVALPHGYVLADRTVQLSPDGWGRRAVQAAVDYECDDICVEINYGGDMAVSTIRSAAEHMGINIPIRVVRATRGKRVRAEPVAALTEQDRWHIVGNLPALENQMTTWYPELDWSPDRLDAMVWPGWHQKIVKLTMTGNATPGGMSSINRKIA